MDTNEVAKRLVDDAKPVRRIPKPWVMVSIWLAVAVPYLALIVLLMSPRPDLGERVADTRFQLEQLVVLAVALAAAWAAFTTAIPGRSKWPVLFAAVLVGGWFATLGLGCIADWLRMGPDGLILGIDWICFPTIAIAGIVPAAAIVAMLRRGAPLTPHLTIALAALAAAALGNFGLRLFHPQDVGIMVLVWQFGSVIAMAAFAGWIGDKILNWRRVTA